MPIYSGTSIKNVFDLINRDNPDLPFPCNSDTFLLGAVNAITPTASGHNTTIRLVPKNGTLYRGGITLTYRRIDIGTLFRDIVPTIERFVPLPEYLPGAEVFTLLNANYGTNFDQVDFISMDNRIHYSYAPTRTLSLTTLPASYMYVGTVTIRWNQGREELGRDIMTVTELKGAVWPGSDGNDFVTTPDRSFYGTWLFADRHFTEEASVPTTVWNPVSTSVYTDDLAYPQVKIFVDYLKANNLPYNYDAYDVVTNPKGVGRSILRMLTIALPNAAYPEVNRPGFSFATVLYDNNADRYAKYGRTVMYFNK